MGGWRCGVRVAGAEGPAHGIPQTSKEAGDFLPNAAPEAVPFFWQGFREKGLCAGKATVDPGRDGFGEEIPDTRPELRPLGWQGFRKECHRSGFHVLPPGRDRLGEEHTDAVPELGPFLWNSDGEEVNRASLDGFPPGRDTLREKVSDARPELTPFGGECFCKECGHFARSKTEGIGDGFREEVPHALPELTPFGGQGFCEESADGHAHIVEPATLVQCVRQCLANLVTEAEGPQAANTGPHESSDAGADNRYHRADSGPCGGSCAHHAYFRAAGRIGGLRFLTGGLCAVENINETADDASAAQQAASDGRCARCSRPCSCGCPGAQGPAYATQSAAYATVDSKQRSVCAYDRGLGAYLKQSAKPARSRRKAARRSSSAGSAWECRGSTASAREGWESAHGAPPRSTGRIGGIAGHISVDIDHACRHPHGCGGVAAAHGACHTACAATLAEYALDGADQAAGLLHPLGNTAD